MKKRIKNICRFIPLAGLVVDTWSENDENFFNGKFIMYHYFSSVIFYGSLYFIIRYIIF